MKKFFAIFLVITLLGTLLCGCGGNETENTDNGGDTTSYTVTFDLNYDGAAAPYETQTVEARSAAKEPAAAPTREDYAFEGWFSDQAGNARADFERAITADTTFYAKWTKTVATVTLDPNYEGAEPTTMKAQIGQTLPQPDNPAERTGYLFDTWYTESACTNEYDFSAVVGDDFTLYAGWTALSEDDSSLTATFNWNYDGAPDGGVYRTQSFVSGRRITRPAEPVRTGYSFRGWFTDTQGKNPYELPANPTESITLYAYWLEIFTFEAEDTDVDAIEGSGQSGEVSGKQIIVGDAGASNGHMVSYLFKTGIELVFEVFASQATDNAVLALNLSAEVQTIVLTSEKYVVELNGTPLDYDDITIEGATGSTRAPLRTFEISGVHLNEGANTVKLITNNSDAIIGTMYATAPVVDCLYVYADVNVSWAEGFPKKDNY